jgi:transposase-like protein
VTPEEVTAIRRLSSEGRPIAEIARELGLPYNTVWRAARGYTYTASATVKAEAVGQDEIAASIARLAEKLANPDEQSGSNT